jgi:hypothetical protein
MKKRSFFIPLVGAAFLLSACGSSATSSGASLFGASSASSPQGISSKTSSEASSSGETAFGYFDVFDHALLAYLSQDCQAAVYTNPDLTSYTGVSLSDNSATDASSGVRYAASKIDAVMNHASAADSSNFQAQALISGAQVYTDALGTGTLSPYNKKPEAVDLYLANNALYYRFEDLFLWAYVGGLLRTGWLAQGYDAASVAEWNFPQKGDYPFTGDDLAAYESLFPLTTTMETLGAFVSPLLKDAYGINKNDFAFSQDAKGYAIDYSVTDPLDLYQLARDFATGIQQIKASNSSSSSGYADTLLEEVEKLEPIFEATMIRQFKIVLSFTSGALTSSSVAIDLSWDKAAIKAALVAAGQDDSTYPLIFTLSGSATYTFGDDAKFTLPNLSGYTIVTKPNKS